MESQDNKEMRCSADLMVMSGGVPETDRPGDGRFILLIAVVKFTVGATHFFSDDRLGILHAGRRAVEGSAASGLYHISK